MIHFSYKAKKVSGEEMNGVMVAKDKFDLAKTLREQGYFLVSCKEADEKKERFQMPSFLGSVSTADKIFFSRNLSVMISAGVSIARAMDILARQTKNKKFKDILNEVSVNIKKGNSLSESMKNYPRVFSSIFVAMTKVGEESGKLSESLLLLSEQLDRDSNLIKKIKGALMYPSIIIVLMMAIGIVMLIYVVPTLVSTFEELGAELPASTQIIIGISDFLVNNTILFILALFLSVFSITWFFRSKRGKDFLGTALVHIPMFSDLVKKVNSARTCRTFSSLVSAGVDVVEALSITRDVIQNPLFKKVIDGAMADIQKGISISESFKKADNLYPILVGEMIAIGEETGKLSEMLLRVAGFYEEDVIETTKNMSTIIEPVLMVIIGVVVGFFALSMIKPMYSMVDAI